MRGALAISVGLLAAGVLPAAALPPGPGSPLGPPVQLKIPSAGHATIGRIVVTGTLAAGVRAPTVTPVLGQDPNSLGKNVRLASIQAPATVSGGKATVTIYILINNFVGKRTLAGRRGTDAVDMIVSGASAQWGAPPHIHGDESQCRYWRQVELVNSLRSVIRGDWHSGEQPPSLVHEILVQITRECR